MRKLTAFEYHEPSTLAEAANLLISLGTGASILAGGTDLIAQMKHGKIFPRELVNIKKIADLSGIAYEPSGELIIGALTTLDNVARSTILKKKYPSLAHASSLVGSQQVRNVGTIGGNLCNASPSAETATPLIALGSVARIVGRDGERNVDMEDFFRAPGQTALAPGELLTSIHLPPPRSGTGAVYIKHSYREAMDLAVVGVTVLLRLEGDGETCADCRIALGAVAPTPLRVPRAEERLHGREVSPHRIDEAAVLAAEDCRPISDVRASATYRREMVRVMVRRAAAQALSLAKSAM